MRLEKESENMICYTTAVVDTTYLFTYGENHPFLLFPIPFPCI